MTKRTSRELLPSYMATIDVVEAGQTESFLVPADPGLGATPSPRSLR
jgi:hypothetical protein